MTVTEAKVMVLLVENFVRAKNIRRTKNYENTCGAKKPFFKTILKKFMYA
jgi:hypothetical protein